jgi:hypothetical protein
MSETRYSLVFDGRLQAGTSLRQARDAIQDRFKLSSRQLERLFSGGSVTVKRDLDAASADRYQRAFLDAGAIVERRALDQKTKPAPLRATTSHDDARDEPGVDSGTQAQDTNALELLPPGATVSEERAGTVPPPPDTSRLSLALPEDSGLHDCTPQSSAPPKLDLSRYRLLPLDADSTDSKESDVHAETPR